MATGTTAPTERRQWFDNDGAPLAGGKVYYYRAGLATLATVYQDADLTTTHTNPVVLDSAGRAAIFLAPGAYDVQVKTSADALIYQVLGVLALAAYTLNDTIDGVAGENLAKDAAVFLSDGSGGRTAGRWYMTDADAAATSTTPEQIGIVVSTSIIVGSSGSIRRDGRAVDMTGPLTPGALYYVSATPGGLTTSAPANARLVGQADTTTSLVMAPQTASLPAGRVTAGSFPSGIYVFPAAVHAVGPLGVGTTTPAAKVAINGGLHVGGDSDPGDNNAAVDGTLAVAGNTTIGGGSSGGRVTVNQAVNGSGLALYIQSLTRAAAERIVELSGGTAGQETYSLVSGHWNVGAAGTEALPALTLASDTDTGARLKAANSWGFSSNGAEVASFGAGFWAMAAALFGTAVISPTALVSGTTTSNWAPTGFSTALVVRVANNDGLDVVTLTGLAGGAAGRIVLLFNIDGTQSLRLLHEGALSTAANRFACGEADNSSYVSVPPETGVLLWYDGTSSRWRVISGASIVG